MKKGSLIAPLFFLALAFACLGSRLGAVALWASAALALAIVFWAANADRGLLSSLSLPVLGYGVLVALNTLLLSPVYTPAGLYLPALLILAFLVARALGAYEGRAAALATLIAGAIIVAWGLIQFGLLGVARAQSFLETPAIYAAVINLLLVPALALVLVGRRGALPLVVVPLAAAIFAADSRGGYLALAAGLGFTAVFAIRAQLLKPRALGLALASVAAGWIIATALRTSPSLQPEAAPTTEARAESTLSRLELYALSWAAWRERPLTGTGYLSYRYTLEQGRAQVPSYGKTSETWFVHNDYLQTLQELGPIGLAAFLGLALFPPLLAYWRLPSVAIEQRPIVVAGAAAVSTMSVHALVDFPFYVPICLLLYGAWLGALDRRLETIVRNPILQWRSSPLLRVARAGALTLVVIALLRPVAAEAAAEWGLRKSAAGDGQIAAFWLGTAQRIEPKDWRYHWYAGRFWDAQAMQSGRREAAMLAAEAFDAGFEANPLEVKNLLGKISVHRRHRQLLDEPADDVTLRKWLAQALALAPMNPDVRREIAR
ncbi:MAG: O-antigen ligase family protein [Burkholderiales bacterium]